MRDVYLVIGQLPDGDGGYNPPAILYIGDTHSEAGFALGDIMRKHDPQIPRDVHILRCQSVDE